MINQTGERLKNARKNAGLTQADAALAMDISRPTLSAIESGKRMVYVYEILKFADLYHVTINELICDEERYKKYDRLQLYYQMFTELSEHDQNRVIDIMKNIYRSS